VKLDGFSHKLPVLARFVFDTLAGLQVEADAFSRVQETLVRQVRRARPTAQPRGLRCRMLRVQWYMQGSSMHPRLPLDPVLQLDRHNQSVWVRGA
jgi:secreted Zn-dependent insulinase-like peptidase